MCELLFFKTAPNKDDDLSVRSLSKIVDMTGHEDGRCTSNHNHIPKRQPNLHPCSVLIQP
jgi:hypothetical protein